MLELTIEHVCELEHVAAGAGEDELEFTTETIDQDDEEGSGDEDDDEDTEEDKNEAFNDIEDEDVICSNYVSAPRTKMLPQAVVIGVRKGGTRLKF